MPTCQRCATPIDREHNETGPVEWGHPATPTPAPDAVAEGLQSSLARLLNEANLPELAVEPDHRPGMSWNDHIVFADDSDTRIAFMSNSSKSNARAALIVAAINALPQLLAALPASQPVADVGTNRLADRQKWQTQHTSTTNDLVQMGLARDAAEAQVATLTARVETVEGALRPFAKIAYDIITNRLDDETLADSMAADRLTWGDLRKARAALSPDPAVKPSEGEG